MTLYDTLLDGLAGVISRDPGIWDHVELLCGYKEAIYAAYDHLTADEYFDLLTTITEMQFGFEPAEIEHLEAA